MRARIIERRNETVIVIPGPSSQNLGRKIADFLKVECVSVEFKTFPDGESYIRLNGDVKGQDVTIVQTTGPPQNTHLMQLLLLVDAAKDLGAHEVTAVIPYLAYTRQDTRFLSGEALSIKLVMTLLETCGVNRIVTVNSHNPKVLQTFHLPVIDVSAIGVLADYVRQQGLAGALSVSIGKKALEVAKQADHVLKGGYACIATQRHRVTGQVECEQKLLDVENRDAVLFDDIISTGGTMAKAVKMVKDQGARRVYVACVHPLLIGDAREKIVQNGADAVIGTDCLPSPISVVSVAPLIAQSLHTT